MKRIFASISLFVVLGGLVSACGGGGADAGAGAATGPVSQADIDKALTTPTTLTFWTWLPKVEQEVALFEKQHPAIKVNVVNAGQGLAHYQKLRTALRAGSGAPDLAQIEFQSVSTFSITKDLVDLRPYGADAVKSKFTASALGQVTGSGGQIWAYPTDTGPLEMLYRKDIFDKYGIKVPTTWQEFGDAARKLHAADPNVYLTDLASGQGVAWMGLLWQAGVKPHTVSGADSITLDFTGPQAKKVADFWTGLNKDGVIATDPDFTDQWYQALNKGKYATWISGAWAPVFLEGNAKDTAGKWRVAELPRWTAGEDVNGAWGGSTNAVLKSSKNPIAAAKLAEFLATDPEVVKMYTTVQNLFPATNDILQDPSWTGQTSAFYGGQQLNQVGAKASAAVRSDFGWSPFQDQIYSYWQETVGAALTGRTDLAAASQAWQDKTKAYASGQGFKVSP